MPGPGFNVDPQGNAERGSSPATGAYRKQGEGISDPYEVSGRRQTPGQPTGTTGQPVNPIKPLFQEKNKRQRISASLSNNQFSQKPVMRHLERGLDVYETSKAFQHMGMTAAVRYAIGAPPTYRHLQDLLTGNNLRRGAEMNNGNTTNSTPPNPIIPNPVVPPGEA